MGKFRKTLAIALCAFLALPLVACGGGSGGGGGDDPSGDVLKVKFAVNVDQYTKAAWQQIIADYNAGQGKTDGVKIVPTYNEGSTDAQLKTKVSKKKVDFGVVALSDRQFKDVETGSSKGLFLELDSYLTADVKAEIGYNDIPASLLDRYSLNINKVTDGYNKATWEAGKGTSLLAMPYGDEPETLFYNKDIFQNQGVNIISVAEDKLDAYNAANNTEFMPHGYAEYASNTAWCAAAGLKTHKNLAGKIVYMVFNNRIPMNWEETRYLAYYFMSGFGGNYQYGFMTEWWFSYGWGVGGDCIGWDYDAKEYKFTIGDKQDNFLVLVDGLTVRNSTYNKGDVMIYEDALYVNRNAAVKQELLDNGKVCTLPSQYEAFLEINRYGIPSNKDADVAGGRKGYGISKSTTQNRQQEFVTGTNCPMLVESYGSVNAFSATAMVGKYDIAHTPQYRKYKDIEYTIDVKTEWKVIGENGYTGELETANGVAIKGRATTGSTSYALAIPKNADKAAQDGGFKFIKYVSTYAVEKILAATQAYVPIHTSYAMSEEYNSVFTRVTNGYAGGMLAKGSDLGDWSYFQNNTWIDAWSSKLNDEVRAGTAPWTLTYFVENVSGPANDALRYMEFRLLGR